MYWIVNMYLLLLICIVNLRGFEASNYIQSIYEMKDNVMVSPDYVWNYSWPINETVKKPCAAFLNAYADHSSVFTRCLVQNARPFRLCETCVESFKKASTVFQDLNDESNPCFKRLLSADRVQVIRLLNDHMKSVWRTSDCQNCFSSVTEDPKNGTVNVTLNNSTEEFRRLYRELSKCLNDTIEDPDIDVMKNVSVCDKCRKHYRSLNKHFKSVQDSTMNHACMDVVDMMNYSRIIWSQRFNCTHRKGEVAPVLLISTVICVLPAVFYICHRLYGGRYQKKIIKQKRMHRPVESLYGSTGNSNSIDSRINQSMS